MANNAGTKLPALNDGKIHSTQNKVGPIVQSGYKFTVRQKILFRDFLKRIVVAILPHGQRFGVQFSDSRPSS